MKNLLLGNDDFVAAWVWRTCNLQPMHVNKAIGILDVDGSLVGAALFQSWNATNINLSYHGPNTLTPSIVHCLANIAISEFNVARVTALTSKLNRKLIQSMLKLGFTVEGTQRCYYGRGDTTKNTAVRLVIFRERLEKLVKIAKVA